MFALNLSVKSSIWPIDRALATTPGQSELGAVAMKGFSAFPKATALLEPNHHILQCCVQDTRWGVLPLCRDAVDAFYTKIGKHPTYMLALVVFYGIWTFVGYLCPTLLTFKLKFGSNIIFKQARVNLFAHG